MPMVITVAQLSQQHSTFWAHEAQLMQERLNNPAMYCLAMASLEDEATRLVPIRHRMSLEYALKQADEQLNKIRLTLQSEAASKAGRSAKPDSLQLRIIELAIRNQNLSEKELFRLLQSEQGLGIIQNIDDARIWFIAGSSGKLKSTPISGLRGRLSRAKAKLQRTQSR